MNKKTRYIKLLSLFIVGIFAIISINVLAITIFKVHLRSGTKLSAYAENANYINNKIVARRGFIYDRNGNIVAQDVSAYDVICVLDKNRIAEDEIAYVADPSKTASALAKALNADEKEIYALLTQKDVFQTELGLAGRNISAVKKEEIEKLNLPGVEFRASTTRNYPIGNFSPYIVGFAQKNDEEVMKGVLGIEALYDEVLKGVDGSESYQADQNGFILPGMKAEKIPAKNGDNIYLTLDKGVQEALDIALKESVKRYNASDVWASVVEVESGKVLAWGQYPSFDQNKLGVTDYIDRGIQYAYEPGSVFKPIIYSSTINEGKYNGNELYDSRSFHFLSDSNNNPVRTYDSENADGRIDNAEGESWGAIPIDQGLIRSSNVATSTLLSKYLGSDKFYQYVDKFGFFKPVNTDKFDDVVGQHNFQYAVEKLNMSFGQGISTTMLHLDQAYTAIFGNGEMVKPYFVDKIVDGDTGKVKYKHNREVVGNPITKETAQQVQKLMRRVVTEEYGTGGGYQPNGMKIIAKTGTAEVALPEGGYDGYNHICSVIVGFPADNPKYMMYYATKAHFDFTPHYSNYPVVNFLNKASKLLEIEDKKNNVNTVQKELKESVMPNVLNNTVAKAKEKLKASGADVYIIGDGDTIIAQSQPSGDNIYSNEKILLKTNGTKITLPNFKNWTRKEVVAYWQISNLSFVIKGSGIVVAQNITEGSVADPKKQIEITLKDTNRTD